MTLLRIAFRNVLKNRRRSIVTGLTVALGFAAVAVFQGYMQDAYQRIALGAIYLEAPGHLVVFRKGFLDQGRIDPARFLFSSADVRAVEESLAALPGVVWVAPKLSLSGLVTNGTVSTVFVADAMEPSDETALWKHFPFPGEYSPHLIPDTPSFAALMAPKLANLLQFSVGSEAVLMATTRHGQMNAVDVQVTGLLPPLADALDDKYIKIPLSLARNLYDFDGADRICVLVRDMASVAEIAKTIMERLRSDGVDVDVKTWQELSLFYEKVTGYLDTVFMFLFTIVAVIVVAGTFNTMSMAILERTREVGTLRAMGLKVSHVVAMFSLEGLLLGLIGSTVGFLFTAVAWALLEWARLSYLPPGAAERVSIRIDLVPSHLFLMFFAFVVLSVASAVIPARRASRQPIVDALGHV